MEPTILFYAGAVGTFGFAVLCCKKSLFARCMGIVLTLIALLGTAYAFMRQDDGMAVCVLALAAGSFVILGGVLLAVTMNTRKGGKIPRLPMILAFCIIMTGTLLKLWAMHLMGKL